MSFYKRLSNKVQSIRWNLKNRLHHSILRRLDLELLLTTGVRIKVKSWADWVIYTSIFADNEYDTAIHAAIAQKPVGSPLNVLDVGANVGFFALRVAHLMAHAGSDAGNFRITCIEGSPTTYAELVQRLAASPALRDRHQAVHGLAGKLDGTARIDDAFAYHAMTSLFAQNSAKGTEVPFRNLNTLVEPCDSIDFLKCDIEGSEWDLIQNYGDLLRRTRVAVFEFHHDKCSRTACQERLRSLGFDQARTLQEDKFTSLELFERRNPQSENRPISPS
jgi:FkbM family methyltransferase